MLPLSADGAGATGDTTMSSTQHQLIEQCATRLRGIVEALDNIHDNTPRRWSTELDDVHSSAESLLALIKDQAPTQAAQDLALRTIAEYPCPEQDNMTAANMRQVAADAITGALAFGAQASQPPAEDHWLRPFYDIGRAEGQRTQDLAMLVRMLASSLKRHAPDSNLVARATNYLAAKGLAGTPLRDAPASVEQAGGDRWDALQSIMEWTAAENIPDDRKLCLIRNAARAALAQPSPAPADEKPGDSILCYGCFAKGVGPEHFDEAGKCLVRQQTEPLGAEFAQVLSDNLPELLSTAQAEQAEAERPEVVAFRYHCTNAEGEPLPGWFYSDDAGTLGLREPLMTVAQYDRIVGALLRQKHEADTALAWATRHYQALEQERDAALARVDALAVQVLKLGGTISFAHHRTDQAGQVPQAWLDVQAERRRQVEAEGWTPEHDDAHSHGEMARAAACYALAGSSAPNDGTAALLVSLAWPWDEQWWKPTSARRDLVKACALALAEIERLDRAGISQNPQPGATTASS